MFLLALLLENWRVMRRMTDICHNCGNEYSNLSMHWHQSSSCDFPELTPNQREIVTGVLMGDGTVSRPGANPLLSVVMVTEDYLNYLDNKLGKYGKGVVKKMTAEQSAKKNRDRGFRPDAKAENYSSVYRLDSRTSPEFEEFIHWYDSGKKVFPEDIELTPTTLKHWYVCDGTYSTHGGANRIEIAATNEIERFDNIVSSFNDIGFEAKTTGKAIYFSNSKSQDVFDYMGEPLPGFEYKWPN